MLKKMCALILFFGLTACVPNSDSGNGGTTGSPTSNYASCEALPAGSPMAQNPCPGAVGTWNNYEIEKDSSGMVTSYKLWCGGTVEDHPSTQSEYDMYMIPGGNTSNNDFKSGSDCVSGSNQDSSGAKIVNIWQQVK